MLPFLTTLGATPLRPDGLEEGLRYGLDASWYALVFVAVLSLPLWLRRDARRLLLVNLVAVWTLFHIAFLGEPRYHVPLYPIFIIAAAGGVAAALAAAQGALARRRARPA
jgi:predicted MFS family arabinose efflux permease